MYYCFIIYNNRYIIRNKVKTAQELAFSSVNINICEQLPMTQILLSRFRSCLVLLLRNGSYV